MALGLLQLLPQLRLAGEQRVLDAPPVQVAFRLERIPLPLRREIHLRLQPVRSLRDVHPVNQAVQALPEVGDRVGRLPVGARDELLVAALVSSPAVPLVDAEVVRLAEAAGFVRVGDCAWSNLGGVITATNSVMSTLDPAPLAALRFYHVVLLP